MTLTTVTPVLLQPTSTTIAAHLIAEHLNTGIPAESTIGVPADELLRWHDVDHRLASPQYLGHDHGPVATATEAPADADERIHRDTLKAIREGRPVPNLEKILDRAAEAALSIAAAKEAAAEAAAGRPTPRVPGLGVVSPYDRRCLEIAQAVAERTARLAARRGKAA